MLRSSSTPVIGSILSSLSDSPNRDFESSIVRHSHSQSLLSQGLHQHNPNLTPVSCCSSPVSGGEITNGYMLKGFGRSRSEGCLQGLAVPKNSCDKAEAFRDYCPIETNKSMLRSAPSFSIYNSVEDEEKIGEALERKNVTIGESIYVDGAGRGSGEFSFEKKNMGLIEEEGEDDEGGGIQRLSIEEEVEPRSPPMYVATEFGIGTDGFDGGEVVDLTFDESGDVEEYYKRLVDEYPCHPLLLRNYANFLQSKGDLHGAEDYYHRATLADPADGAILLLYAKLVWELYHDRDRALPYYERAAQAAPQDSNVLAAYASFLWETEDDKEDDIAQQKHVKIEKEEPNNLNKSITEKGIESVSLSLDTAAELKIDRSSTAADASRGGNVEDYLRRMVEENPCNPLILRNYAQFLCQSKGDLHGAEEYYSRAILADPGDGEIMSLYAKLVWELHHDHDKALGYFERAVRASPTDSYVLGAYASFLWETEEDEEEDGTRQDHSQAPIILKGAVTTANA